MAGVWTKTPEEQSRVEVTTSEVLRKKIEKMISKAASILSAKKTREREGKLLHRGNSAAQGVGRLGETKE